MYYNENTILYLNGEFIKAAEAKTGLYDQSIHYGYAVFEGIRAYKTQNGTQIFKAEEHYERLKFSAESVSIPYHHLTDVLIDISYELLAKNNFQDAYLRPLVFCPPNMNLQKAKEYSIMIAAWEWEAYLGNKLLRVMTSSYQRPNPKGFKIHAKVSGHYINSILACQEAKDNGYDEALLLDINNFVAEGPGANVFFEKNGKLFTPPAKNILPGITRSTVFEICTELDISVEEKYFTIDELKKADTVFYCGTAAEVIGWESLDDVKFAKPWDETISKVIQEAYKCKVLQKEFKRSFVRA
ncbi:MAG TPA: branched-chain amino acid transaminase [Chitinophagaceae bacterium]|nr:branched-chain amino acid transaminase [Chitinophagaceae bacterium]